MWRHGVQGLALAVIVGAVSSANASSAVRVIGGTPIHVQAAPWAVVVATVFHSTTEQDCTGSVIDASHVLTAAHCLYDTCGVLAQPSSVYVLAGVSNFLSPISSDQEQDRSASSFRVHPGYVYSTVDMPDDVAVLTLSAPLDLSGGAVQAVALPAPNAPFPAGGAVSIAGFGLQLATGGRHGRVAGLDDGHGRSAGRLW